MAKVLVLGAGLMGPAIASDLLKHEIAERVVIADIDAGRVEEAVRRLGPDRCEGTVLDVWNRRALVDAMRGADVVAGAYPVAAVAQVTEAAVEAGASLADLTGSAEGFDIFTYHDRAVRAGVTILPGCGVAPGLTNALVGQGAARLDRPSEGVIYVGGLPLHPRPPLEYRLVFSIDTVIDEYVAPALVIREGRVVEVPALDGLEPITF
ncbi:MAG: saccharopine dehydrogenase NADP-binding domain-containing protein, partial [Bacillota bacterium]|nr:saccharopine dehydrogenase NADP-binding domain-containing protein [Bacillota bacterium]